MDGSSEFLQLVFSSRVIGVRVHAGMRSPSHGGLCGGRDHGGGRHVLDLLQVEELRSDSARIYFVELALVGGRVGVRAVRLV